MGVPHITCPVCGLLVEQANMGKGKFANYPAPHIAQPEKEGSRRAFHTDTPFGAVDTQGNLIDACPGIKPS